MKAWVIESTNNITKTALPLTFAELPKPIPNENQVLIKVFVCGMCHTELDEIEGRTPPPVFPMVPGQSDL